MHLTLPHLVRVKCSPDNIVGGLKMLIAAQTDTDERIQDPTPEMVRHLSFFLIPSSLPNTQPFGSN